MRDSITDIDVALVEDDTELRQTFALIIDGTPGFSCKRSFGDCESALPALLAAPPDVLLMDIQLPGMSGVEGVAQLRKQLPELDILMLTVQVDADSVFDSLCAGANGYLVKDTPPARLLDAIREVREGGSPMSGQIARKVVASFHRKVESPLSERETEILRRLCDGQSYSVIAEGLFISGHTVRTHIKNIYHKLHVNSRAQAVNKALKDRLI